MHHQLSRVRRNAKKRQESKKDTWGRRLNSNSSNDHCTQSFEKKRKQEREKEEREGNQEGEKKRRKQEKHIETYKIVHITLKC